jgi:translation initiation factor IF-2
MPANRLVPVLLLCTLIGALPLVGADQAEREALRYNDAVTKLQQTRDEAQANLRVKAITALTVIAKSRLKAEDATGAGEAYRAILSIDREHEDARIYFTTLGTLAAVLAELDAKPTDLLGLDTGDGPTKDAPAKDAAAKNAPLEKN